MTRGGRQPDRHGASCARRPSLKGGNSGLVPSGERSPPQLAGVKQGRRSLRQHRQFCGPCRPKCGSSEDINAGRSYVRSFQAGAIRA
jgi:hypothetical protein